MSVSIAEREAIGPTNAEVEEDLGQEVVDDPEAMRDATNPVQDLAAEEEAVADQEADHPHQEAVEEEEKSLEAVS